jgi:HEAT repeat protein
MEDIEKLINTLDDPRYLFDRVTRDTVVKSGDSRFLKPLTAALRDPNAQVRRNTADILRNLFVLHHRNSKLRMAAMQILESFVASLGDADDEVRTCMAVILGEIGDPRAVPELERVAREDKRGRWHPEDDDHTDDWFEAGVADVAEQAVGKIQGKMRRALRVKWRSDGNCDTKSQM